MDRATGRTFRSCLEVLKRASESEPNSLTLLVVGHGEHNKRHVYEFIKSMTPLQGLSLDHQSRSITLPGNRKIQVVNVVDKSRDQNAVTVCDHTVLDNLSPCNVTSQLGE